MEEHMDEAQRAVEELVAHYQAKARAVARAGVAAGAVVGVLVGAIPLSPLRAAWPIPSSFGFATLLGGLVVGVMIGYVVGDPRAKLYQRMAEQARLQLQLEQRISQNDARMAQLLTALTARAAASAQRGQPAPAAAPAPPAPAATPAPAPLQHVHAVPPPVTLPPVQAPPEQAQPLRTTAHLTPVPVASAPSGGQTFGAPSAPPLSPPVSG